MFLTRRIFLLFVLFGLITLSFAAPGKDDMNAVAKRYAHLVLALGEHDPDYVDAFYGPSEWKTQAEKTKQSLDQISSEGEALKAKLAEMQPGTTPVRLGPAATEKAGDEMDCCAPGMADNDLIQLRREYLQKQISALGARVRMLKGEKLKFDDESRALYDAVAPTYPDSHFDQIIAQLDKKIPGSGPLWERYEKLAEAVCDSEGETRCGVSTRDQGVSRPDAGAHCASA